MRTYWWLVVALVVAFGLVVQPGCRVKETVSPATTSGAEVAGKLSGLAGGVLQVVSTYPQASISVTGEGRISVVPDTVVLNLGIETIAKTVREARDQAAETMDAVMAALIGSGVAKKDITTLWFSIYPEKRWTEEGGEELVGYRVTNMLTTKVRKVEDVGRVLDAAIEAGGDLIQVQGISFTVDDPSPYYDQARKEAVANAKAKGEQLASLTGVTLGKPLQISESVGTVFMPVQYGVGGATMMKGEGGGTPISPGETEVYVAVYIVYNIE